MLRQTRWKKRLEVSSSSSRNTPARNSWNSRSISSPEMPARLSAVSVDWSVPPVPDPAGRAQHVAASEQRQGGHVTWPGQVAGQGIGRPARLPGGIGETHASPAGVQQHPRGERAELQGTQVDPPPDLRVGGIEYLEAAIEQETRLPVGAHPAADGVPASSTRTVAPAATRSVAHARPASPAPITTARSPLLPMMQPPAPWSLSVSQARSCAFPHPGAS
jgi:hypothetical protein